MTQQQEKLSAFMDGEISDSDIIDAVKNDSELQAKWRSYHVIRSGLRKEASVMPEFDITAQVAQALADEPTIMAPKGKWRKIPVLGNIVPLFKQSGQFAVAASVAAAVILGVQHFNQPAPTEPFMTAPTVVGPQGGLSPVSLEQTRTLPRNDMSVLLEKRRQINALIADHEQQVKLKQAQENKAAVSNSDESTDIPE
jgi:sigma-E factor negative regulatory protein RseA